MEASKVRVFSRRGSRYPLSSFASLEGDGAVATMKGLLLMHDDMAETMAYCVKCRAKREMKNAKEVSMKGGRRAMSGVCVKCGTKMFTILGKKK